MTTTVNNRINELIELLQNYAEQHGDEEMPAQAESSNAMYDDIIAKVKEWFPNVEQITFKDIKKMYKAKGYRPPNNKDINIAFVDSDDYCISNTGNVSTLIKIDEKNAEKERRAHVQLLSATIKDKEGRGLMVKPAFKQLIDGLKNNVSFGPMNVMNTNPTAEEDETTPTATTQTNNTNNIVDDSAITKTEIDTSDGPRVLVGGSIDEDPDNPSIANATPDKLRQGLEDEKDSSLIGEITPEYLEKGERRNPAFAQFD